MSPEKQGKPNRLINEKSPYLLQHAYNVVDWYPWGEEALKKARNDGKPIFLSIGYSTCHWCHVFAKESFEDPVTAQMINKNFIPIKVDREERPEIDAYYMSAVQAMTGGGGWPLSVFLTPDLKPFYGGTYFPPEPRYGMPSFRQVLEFASKIWKERREEAISTGEQVAQAVQQRKETGPETGLTKDLLDGVYASLASSFDSSHGGFGSAPKFPLPLSLSFMLRYHYRTGKEMALTAATKTLDAMAAGGIRDHVGGGFHRYATDRVWLVPHFEKMLYDNALLAKVYAEAHLATKNEGYLRVARETLGWMGNELESEEGGFYSAQDADTEDGEGAYYTWTPDEVDAVLGKSRGGEFCREYGVTRAGNFEGRRSILHLASERTAQENGPESWRGELYQARLSRPRPRTDTKILTGWNGLAISALCAVGRVSEDGHIESAKRAADFILARCVRGGKLLRCFSGGESGIAGTLEDYSFFVQGLLDLFETTWEARWLETAERLSSIMVEDFADPSAGGFFMSMEAAPARLKEGYDGPTPSGNSVAALNLVRLFEITGDEKWRKLADRTLTCFAGDLEEQPSGHAYMACALDASVNGMKAAVITAKKHDSATPMVREISRAFRPDVLVVMADGENFSSLSRLSPLLEGRMPGPTPVAYVCEGFACKLPAKTPEELGEQLSRKNR